MGRGGGGRSGGGRSGGGRSSGGGGRSSARSSGGRSGGGGGRSSARSSRGYSAHSFRGGNFHRGSIHIARRTVFESNAFSNAIEIVLILAATALVFAAIIGISFSLSSSLDITSSTVKREKLQAQYVTVTDWYTDELGWINSGTKLTDGMRAFYDKTGVQPYLYITDTVNGTTSPSDEDMEIYARALYDKLFADEGHILLLFYEHNSDSNYKTRYVCGAMAKIVMDDEACDILLDYVDHYYFSNLQDDEMFSAVFEKAGNRIMRVTMSPVASILLYGVIAPILLGGLLVVFILSVIGVWSPLSPLYARRAKKALENQEKANELERILDIGFVEDPALKELEEKYGYNT